METKFDFDLVPITEERVLELIKNLPPEEKEKIERWIAEAKEVLENG